MLLCAGHTTVTCALPSLELIRVCGTYPEAVGLPLPSSCQEVEERQEQEEEDQSYVQSTGTPANQTGKHFSPNAKGSMNPPNHVVMYSVDKIWRQNFLARPLCNEGSM